MKASPRTHVLGFPRIGAKRELKKATEAYWQGKISHQELESVGRELRQLHWLLQREAGIDLIPSNDFSFYDHVLDTTCLVGNVPRRFEWNGGDVNLDTRFAIARGVRPHAQPAVKCESADHDAHLRGETFASEMTKWFDTNYHYIVPEFHADTRFTLTSSKPVDEFNEALALGLKTKPVLLGPVTYLTLGKSMDASFDRLDLIERLLPVYIQVLRQLAEAGAEWVQFDEPAFTLDLSRKQRAALTTSYATLAAGEPRLRLLVATYFGGLRDNLSCFLDLPVAAVHIDATREPREVETVLREFPREKILSLGLIDGRNVWRHDFDVTHVVLDNAIGLLGAERVWVAPSCSLLHSPVTLRFESKLDSETKPWLAFAEEKLREVVLVRDLANGTAPESVITAQRAAIVSRKTSARIYRPDVKARISVMRASDASRSSEFRERQRKQKRELQLPLFPTTTIGSFPQTEKVRSARARWKKGELSTAEYQGFLEQETASCIHLQEEIGIDVLVHGEFERNDMVEYFGEQLDGFAFTENGWVQSYGSRCVKPPIIYGDVARPCPMTVDWAKFAQAQTRRPMKGMLTGPITILQWSFVRDDQPRRETAFQIALALRDEVLDLERAGIRVIQIDEPALREGLPLRREDWKHYLEWSVNAFRLTAAGVRDETQIHTHMCYAEFNDIIGAIARLDADVITIETSRSNMEFLQTFEGFQYPNEIGPGVYDIHSPRVPTVEEMKRLLEKAMRVLPQENLWVNPDCGLKTRRWPEVEAALRNMVRAARELRGKVEGGPA